MKAARFRYHLSCGQVVGIDKNPSLPDFVATIVPISFH
jgi:hypothetical protein